MRKKNTFKGVPFLLQLICAIFVNAYCASCGEKATKKFHNDRNGVIEAELDVIPKKKDDKKTTPPDPPGPPGPSDLADGIKLWNDYCLSCHQSYQSTDKIGATAEIIKNAIISVPQMQNLGNLNDRQIDLIAAILSINQLDTGQAKVNLGNRSFIYSKFTQLFNGNNSPSIKTVLDSMSILQNSGMLGGACSPNSAICSWAGIDKFGNIKHVKSKDAIRGAYAIAAHVGHQGFANTVRSGLVAKTCAKLTSINLSLTNLLTTSSLDSNSTVNAENIKKLIYSFTPGRTSSPEAIQKLEALGQAAKSKNLPTQDVWRIISYTICASDWNEGI